MKFAFVVLASALACAQTTSQAAASGMVSPGAASSSIKIEPATPKDAAAESEIVADPASLLPDPPAVPHAKASLIGGTIQRLDRVRDQITLNVFGGGHMKVMFDPRTRIYSKGAEVTTTDLREGERISIDTILDGSTVFARSIRVKSGAAVGESQGVVVKYRADRGELTLRDAISPEPVHIRLSSSTRLTLGDREVPASTLQAGSLVGIKFNSEGTRDVAREIAILAVPGVHYTFAGQVAHLDLSKGLLVLNSSTDHKTYEIHIESSLAQRDDVHTGETVTIMTAYEDSRYVARTITIDSATK
jgi:hypothetical protein